MFMKNKKGFTLVELSLSIAFIAILSITIALIINDAISTYRRGLTLNQINTVGMDLVDDMRATIQNSPANSMKERCASLYKGSDKTACENEKGLKLVVVKKTGKVDGVSDNIPIYGAFCTGAYSYVWNSGYFFSDKKPEGEIAFLKYGDTTYYDFRLLKVKDINREVCMSALQEENGEKRYAYKTSDTNNFILNNTQEEPTILLADDNANSLALYDLTSQAPVSNGVNAAFYATSFILGTLQGGINVMSSGNFCAAPSEYDSNFDYCAINKFNFAAQANGG